jgi:MYXO-CTERM domain-containing protein
LASIVSDSIVFETCNDLDDDCDGAIDEDFPAKGAACSDGGQGVCQGTGNRICNISGDGTVCDITTPGQAPGTEVCNGLDDNCNNLVDEGLNCIANCVPTGPDLCDGIDNDCDSAIDEADPLQGTQCGTTDQGTCEFGTNLCIAGSIQCVGEEGPGTEICNGLDDDCDGNADNMAMCPGATSCIDGGCRLACTGEEFSCPAGFDCLPDAGGMFCIPSPCATCLPGESCIDNACVDLCAGVSCEANETCNFGSCYDCNVLGCEVGEVCFDSACIADPCLGIDCAATCAGDDCSCVEGVCVEDCNDEDCPPGERCNATGVCEANACADVICSSSVCIDGECVLDPCAGVSCGLGEVCVEADCVPDPCALVTCSEGRACEVREDGTTFCKSTGENLPADQIVVGGGGGQGCSTTGGTSRGAGLLLLLAAIALATRRKRETLALAAMVAAGCNFNPYEFENGGGEGGDGDGGGISTDANDDAGVNQPDAGSTCTVVGVDDQCDNIDNDCNGVVDDAFDKTMDGNNCGECGLRCTAPGTILECQNSSCVITDCQPGFVDLDPLTLGCEYACPLFPAQAEDCNGVDDDCDGQIDEAADLPPPPAGQCRVTPGTPCAGTSMICDTRLGETRWYCDYASDVEFDSSIPNGILLQETLCDGLDGDCDGLADDAFADLGQECDNGAVGICRDQGARICDPADSSTTICDLSVLPDALGTAVQETCNGLDDNCDGIVDNSTGADRVIDDMVQVNHSGLDFFIYRHEASRPDASAGAEGVTDSRSCSNTGVLPWTRTTMAVAEAACTASGSGRRLCTANEYLAACSGPTGTVYPYGDNFADTTCNTEPFDSVPGGNDDDALVNTGSASCTSADGIVDLSGNLKEWTNDITGQTPGGVDIAVLRGGAYTTPATAATCDFRSSRASVESVLETVGFRCCSDSAP